MSWLLWLCCLTVRVLQGQDLETQAAALRALVAQAAKLPLQRTQIKIQADIGYPSSVTMDANGTIYVLQRGENADPVLVVNRDGKIIRSWGQGGVQDPAQHSHRPGRQYLDR